MPEMIAGYRVLGILGRGGMGVVYRAEQISLRRVVALKMIRGGDQVEQSALARFRAEALAVARLRHPNIVQIFEIGEHDGQPFLALELLEGNSLAQQLRRQPVAQRQAVEMLEKLAQAAHAAHQAGIVHRDLKPGNVLLTADGFPKIADFGLAKQEDDEAGQTRTGMIVGTPSYMAPEQAAGKNVGAPADLWALGAILYEMVTGRPPFHGATVHETFDQVLHQEPVSPRRLQPRLSKDVETICLKCLAKEPHRRYASASALADDLGRFLRGEPILARPISRVERLWRWSRRSPALASAASLAVFALLAVAILGISFAIHQSRSADQLRDKQRQTDAALHDSRLRAASLELDRCIALCERGDVALGLLGMSLCLEHTPEDADELRRAVRMNLAAWSRQLATLRGSPLEHSDAIYSVGFSADGKSFLTASYDGVVRVWDTESGKPRPFTIRHPGHSVRAALSPDGTRILTGGYDRTARLWNAHTGEPLGAALEHPDCVRAVAFSPNGQWMATGAERSSSLASSPTLVRVWRTADLQRPPLELPHSQAVRCVTFSSDNKLLLTGGQDGTARLWEFEAQKVRREFGKHRRFVDVVALSPDGARVLTGSGDYTAQMWDAETGKEIGPRLIHQGYVVSLAFLKDGKSFLVGSEDATLRLWDTATLTPLGPPISHPGAVWALALSPDEQTVLTGCGDKRARLWKLPASEAFGIELPHPGDVNSVAFSPDGDTLLTADSGTLTQTGAGHFWKAATGESTSAPVEPFEQTSLLHAAFSPDGKTAVFCFSNGMFPVDLATGTRGKRLGQFVSVLYSPDGNTLLASGVQNQLWNARTWQPIGPRFDGWNVGAFTPDSRMVVAGTSLGAAEFRDARTGKKLAHSFSHDGPIRFLCFSADGKTVFSGSDDQMARFWDAETAKPVGPTLPHHGPVSFGAFLPDDKIVLTMGFDRIARLWDRETGKPVGGPMPHPGIIRSGALSKDGRILLIPGQDGTGRLWDLAASKPLGPPLLHRAPLTSAAFSPDGLHAATASADKSARIWSLPRPVPDDMARVRRWVESLTRMQIDENGVTTPLDEERLRNLPIPDAFADFPK